MENVNNVNRLVAEGMQIGSLHPSVPADLSFPKKRMHTHDKKANTATKDLCG